MYKSDHGRGGITVRIGESRFLFYGQKKTPGAVTAGGNGMVSTSDESSYIFLREFTKFLANIQPGKSPILLVVSVSGAVAFTIHLPPFCGEYLTVTRYPSFILQ